MLVARNDDERARRAQRLGVVEATFVRGAQPRRRAVDLAIAATANVHGVPLLTHNVKDFQVVADLVDVRAPDGTA